MLPLSSDGHKRRASLLWFYFSLKVYYNPQDTVQLPHMVTWKEKLLLVTWARLTEIDPTLMLGSEECSVQCIW